MMAGGSIRALTKRLIKRAIYTVTGQHNAAIRDAVTPFTMTSPERIDAVIEAVRYVVHRRIPGALVECGVWKGGSMMAAALTLRALGDVSRDLYLYDTFTGMPQPGDRDVSHQGVIAREKFDEARIGDDASSWCISPLDEVRANVYSTGYPRAHIHFVEGKVENTIPRLAPDEIALLRLDTDWYESTRHELIHLYPRLRPGGMLIIDDYGHWQGAKQAVDEYIAEEGLALELKEVDYTCRQAIKPVPQAVPR